MVKTCIFIEINRMDCTISCLINKTILLLNKGGRSIYEDEKFA